MGLGWNLPGHCLSTPGFLLLLPPPPHVTLQSCKFWAPRSLKGNTHPKVTNPWKLKELNSQSLQPLPLTQTDRFIHSFLGVSLSKKAHNPLKHLSAPFLLVTATGWGEGKLWSLHWQPSPETMKTSVPARRAHRPPNLSGGLAKKLPGSYIHGSPWCREMRNMQKTEQSWVQATNLGQGTQISGPALSTVLGARTEMVPVHAGSQTWILRNANKHSLHDRGTEF